MMSPTILQMNLSSWILDWRTSILSTGRLMPIIILFDTGWSFIQRMIDKLIYLILLWSWIFSSIAITSLHSLVNHLCNTVWILLPKWNSTPHIRRDKNCHKTSHGAGGFSRNLRVSKELCYNEHNCKSGRHNRQHTFMRCKSRKIRKDTNTTSLPNMDLQVKTRNVE